MVSFRTLLVAALLASISIAPAWGAAMQSYSLTDLGSNTYFTELNDLGQAIGRGPAISWNDLGQLLYTSGKVVDLGQSIRLFTTNSQGEMLAQLPVKDGFTNSSDYVVREPDGSTRPITGMSADEIPFAINAQGQILVHNPAPNTSASLAILSDGHRQSINISAYLGDIGATAFGPNGQVSAIGELPNNGESFSLQSGPNGAHLGGGPDGGKSAIRAYNNVGGFITMDGHFYPAGWSYSAPVTNLPLTPFGLNDLGQVVGSGLGGNAAILIDGSARDLNTLLSGAFAGRLTSANAINNLGQILATGSLDGTSHSFLLTPQTVPEPSSLLVALGLLGAVAVRFRDRRAG